MQGTRTKHKQPKYLSHEDVMKIFNKIPVPESKYLLIFKLMYECCMRVGEVCNLKVRDVMIAEDSIRILDGKGGDRVVAMSGTLANAIEVFIKDKPQNAYAFNKSTGRVMDRQHLDFKLKQYSTWAGLTEEVLGWAMSCHKLRHSGAREYLRRNILNIEDLRKTLGHKYLSTTTIYLETLPEETKEKIRKSGGLI